MDYLNELLPIIFVSLKVSFTATFLATLLAIPVGIYVGIGRFRGRELLTTILNTLMAVPTVVIGLFLYSLLSRKGVLGNLELLYTPLAMMMGQCILAFPIIAALIAGGVRNFGDAPLVAVRMLGASRFESTWLFLKEAKLIVMTGVLAGFGRVFSEIGVSMMRGGNIRFYTRNITTTIALETSKGEFSLGIALGIVLMIAALLINLVMYYFQKKI